MAVLEGVWRRKRCEEGGGEGEVLHDEGSIGRIWEFLRAFGSTLPRGVADAGFFGGGIGRWRGERGTVSGFSLGKRGHTSF